ncbi:MAG: DNA-3-methyladenine glycosylase [Gemmatimonadales bacterium]|nr:MAG: DNA-3-methyladenine glycosylase [Gemmatimonadales bacterium]
MERFAVPAPTLARRMLGWRLVSEVGGVRTSGRVIETEAYLGPEDPASHAATRKGRTDRNASMFEGGGTAYLYFTYGMHWCFNVAAGAPGEPGAVLVRALEPLEGREVMEARRGRSRDLTSGPARLCQALGLDGTHDGHRLEGPPLWIEEGDAPDERRIGVSGRVGIRKARRWPLRFFLEGHPDLSGGKAPPSDPRTLPAELHWIHRPGSSIRRSTSTESA